MKSEKSSDTNRNLDDQTNLVQITFDSIHDQIVSVMAVQARMEALPDRKGHYWMPGSQHRNQAKFVGMNFQSWEQARKCAESEWKAGLQTYDSMREQLADENIPPPKSLKREWKWSEEEGEDLDIDRLQRGQPHLRTTKRGHRPGPVSVTVIADVTTSCGTHWINILWRGAAGILLTEILEKAGYRVELWATNYCEYAYHSGKEVIISTCLKRGSDTLDISSLLNAVSGWYYRTFFFGSYFLYMRSNPVTSLGHPRNPSNKQHLITPDQQVMMCTRVWSKSDAIDWVKQELEKLK